MAGSTGTTENKGASTSSTAASLGSSTSAGKTSSTTPSSGSSASTGSASTSSSPAAKAGSALASLEKVAAAAAATPNPDDASSASSSTATAAGSPGTTEAAREPAAADGQTSTAIKGAPENRIQQATVNARAQGKADVEKEIGWVRELGDREEVEHSVSVLRYANSSRQAALEFYNQLGEELGLPARNAQSTAAATVDSTPKPFTLPKGRLAAEDGTEAFSVPQVAEILKDFRADILREVESKTKPALDFAATGQEQQRISEMKATVAKDAAGVLAEARALPHFKENEKLIAETLKSIPQALRRKVGSVAALYMAYNKILTERVLPTLMQRGEEVAIDDMKRSAAAGSSAVGSTATGGAPKGPILRDGNVSDLAAHMRRLSGGQAATQ